MATKTGGVQADQRGIAVTLRTRIGAGLEGHDFPTDAMGLAVVLGLAEEEARDLIAAGGIDVDQAGCVTAPTLVAWLERNGVEWFRHRLEETLAFVRGLAQAGAPAGELLAETELPCSCGRHLGSGRPPAEPRDDLRDFSLYAEARFQRAAMKAGVPAEQLGYEEYNELQRDFSGADDRWIEKAVRKARVARGEAIDRELVAARTAA